MEFAELVQAFRVEFPDLEASQISEGSHYINAQAAPGVYNGYVHYELIKRGADAFVEFHIESYANGRDELVGRITRVFDCDDGRRWYERDSHYSSYYWRRRTPVSTKDEVIADLNDIKKWTAPVLGHSDKTNDQGKAYDDEVGIVCGLSLRSLLKSKLRIPPYQREFCWGPENINGLFSNICEWMENDTGDFAPFHLGTVILKGNKTPEGGLVYDVVDGQQRLTTMSILYASVVKGGLDEIPLLGNEELKLTLNAEDALIEAKECIDRRREQFKDEWFDKIVVSAVCLKDSAPADLAYRFFNHVNSTGVRLTDYDLLKSHHLRFVPNERAGAAAKLWDRLSYSNGEGGIKSDLLHATLYRLRKWGAVETFPADADTCSDRLVFKHFSAPVELIGSIIPHELPAQFDSLIGGGLPFFNYVEVNRKSFEDFVAMPAVKDLDRRLRWHSGGVLWAGIRALGFLYFCRFGSAYLKEALYCIAFHVSIIRGVNPRIMKRYLGEDKGLVFSSVVSLLRRATGENQFLSEMMDRRKQFSITERPGPTALSYWRSLIEYLKALEPNAVASRGDSFVLSKIVDEEVVRIQNAEVA